MTTSKIFILSASEVKPTLASFMDPSSFPKAYGGELDWQWGDMPNLDEPARELLQGLEQPPAEGQTKKEILKGPMMFQGDKIEVLGTEGDKERRMSVPVPKSEAQTNGTTLSESMETTANGDVESQPTPVPENEKVGLDNVAVNVNQVSKDETQTTPAAA